MDVKYILKLFTCGTAALFTGGCSFIHFVESPARMTMDTANCRKEWIESYYRAKRYMGTLVGLSLTSGCVVCYLGEESKSRMLWLGGCGAIICAKLWTIVAMDPDINMLLKDDVLDTEGETWVRDHIARWNRLHACRTILGASAFGLFMFAALKQ